jgi:hypothetical protein
MSHAEQDMGEPPMDEPKRQDAIATERVVPIEDLEYRGRAALQRAESLRMPLEDAIIAGEPAGPILDELFDLIRLGTK